MVLAHLGYNSSPLIILLALPHFWQKRLKNTKMLYCFLTKVGPTTADTDANSNIDSKSDNVTQMTDKLEQKQVVIPSVAIIEH